VIGYARCVAGRGTDAQAPNVHVIECLPEEALAPVDRKTDGLEAQKHELSIDMPAARRAPGIEVARKDHGAVVLLDDA